MSVCQKGNAPMAREPKGRRPNGTASQKGNAPMARQAKRATPQWPGKPKGQRPNGAQAKRATPQWRETQTGRPKDAPSQIQACLKSLEPGLGLVSGERTDVLTVSVRRLAAATAKREVKTALGLVNGLLIAGGIAVVAHGVAAELDGLLGVVNTLLAFKNLLLANNLFPDSLLDESFFIARFCTPLGSLPTFSAKNQDTSLCYRDEIFLLRMRSEYTKPSSFDERILPCYVAQ